MPIPSGVVCGYTGSAASVSGLGGWSRVTALDSRHTRGADPGIGGGATGGSTSHSHDGTHSHGALAAHTHATGHLDTEMASSTFPGVNVAPTVGIAEYPHGHPISTSSEVDTSTSASLNWSGVTIEPAWYGVIWIQSDGTPEAVPQGAVVWWNAGAAPTNWTRHALSGGRYLKGTPAGQNGGTTGGVTGSAHTHTNSAHTHMTVGHTHTATSGPTALTFPEHSGTFFESSTDTHTHSVSAGSATIAGTSSPGGAASGTSTVDPPFTTLLPITPTTPDAPIGIICLWLGSLASIPPGWALCDGSGGTPDCRSRLVKASSTGADIGTSGGSATHGHSVSSSHSHDGASHGHAVTSVGADGSTAGLTGTGPGFVNATISGHTHPLVGASIPSLALPGAFSIIGDPLVAASSLPPYADVLYIQQTAILGVTITAPTPSQVETSPSPVVSWTIEAGHTQAKYVVNIYDVASGARAYTSGVVVSAANSISVPSGNLHNGHSYRVYVTLVDTGGLGGTAGPVPFSESFTEPAGPAGVTATALPAGTPPNILVTWPAPTVPGGDTFVRWNVLRRVFGDVDWTTVATSTNQGLRGYNDYTAAPGTEYEYAVTFTDTRGGDPVTSAPQSQPPNATLIFLGSWLHVVSDPSTYLGYRSNGIKWVPIQDQVQRFAWGRRTPTYHIGAQRWRSGQLTEAPDFFPAYGGPVPSASQMVDKFLAAQATGAVLCYRFGQTRERFFVIIDATQQNTSRTDDLVMSQQDIMISETFYDESATGA